MKRTVAIVLIFTILISLCGCNIFPNSKNSISKTNNTVITVYNALLENFALREKTGYRLYGVSLTVNSENVGTYTYVYTDKRPDNMKYSDILIVEVNNRTGHIEKFSSPDYATYGDAPYKMIQTAMPLDPASFAVDSDKAMSNAAKAHYNDDFIYNYVQLETVYTDGRVVYNVSHISLINECAYKTTVDVMTGDVLSAAVEEL